MSPMRAKHQCNYQGCKALTIERFCEPHKKAVEKAYDATRGTAAERGYNSTWAKVRTMKLNADPLCERCGYVAVLVHHKDRNPRNNREENLESLCKEDHVKEHIQDRWRR
ncbi:MAG: HNH endonuclease [Syntrophus sp. (in: bacteria)]|nr:HNH endonuclease [Syntrophus sp. (in: bacteria)]